MPQARIVTSNADRRAALAVGHAATRADQPFEHYAALRFRVPFRRVGEWWLLEDDDGTPVTSLMCYPLRLATPGEAPIDGYGIGAVATHPDHRARGHASRLCEAACEHAEGAGRRVGLLYSAIPPALYERLGFQVAPAYGWRCEALDAFDDEAAAAFAPVDGIREVEMLAPLYEAWHPGLHSYRDAEGFRYSCVRSPDDVFFVLGEPARSYVRLYLDESDEVEITELIVQPEDEAGALAFVFALARRHGRPAVPGWMPPTPRIEALFEPTSRAKTLPMVRGYESLDGSMFWSSDYF